MNHGYTNRTELRGAAVRKVYAGPDVERRQAAEHRALTTLHDRLPVPRVVQTGQGWLETTFIDGAHGQDLIAAGAARSVLSETGRTLRRLHALDPRLIDPTATSDDVVQHGDFGPNNLLFDTDSGSAVAVLDWEFSGIGEAVTDIAWCEWIIRMHHPDAVSELPAFFDTYGSTPPWRLRQDAMIRRCRWLEDFTNRWDPGGAGAALWRQRTRTVEGWHEHDAIR